MSLSKPRRDPAAVGKSAPDPGTLGENLVARWLQSQGWKILHRRWRCRWGELDLVIGYPASALEFTDLVFVEVKTRSDRNWDEGGKLAITAQKQAKLWKAAQLFLVAHPEWCELPCRFDVALVHCQLLSGAIDLTEVDGETIAIAAGYRLTLQEYLPSALTLDA